MTDSTSNHSDLESPISDLVLMASVTCTIMEGFLKNVRACEDLTGASVEKVVKTIEAESDELTFCVYHLNSLMQALSRLYFAETEAVA